MNRKTDIDQLLRSWLDEGEVTPPERSVWAALERIETTRQRGALRVSLEEHIMHAQPIAAAAAVAVTLIIGVAAYFVLAGGPNVGDPDLTPTPDPGAVQTLEFGDPLSVVPPEGWVLVESTDSVAMNPPLEGDSLEERIVVFRTAGSVIFEGGDPLFVDWPDDLVAWLEEHPVVSDASGPSSADVMVTGTSQESVAGSSATVIETTTTFTASPEPFETTLSFILPAESFGTDVLLFDGEGQMHFVLLDDRDIAIVYHATDARFSAATLRAVLDSLRFTDG